MARLKSSNPIALPIGDQNVVIDYEPKEHLVFVSLGAALAQIQSLECGMAFLFSSIMHQEVKIDFEAEMSKNLKLTLVRCP